MKTIQFDKLYYKLLDEHNDCIETAKLLLVQHVAISELNSEFLEYDYAGNKRVMAFMQGRKIKDNGAGYLLLIFEKPQELPQSYACARNLFTTIRKNNEENILKYCNSIGECFEIVVKP